MKNMERLDQAKALIQGISEDAQKLLTMVQIAVPAAKDTVKHILDRADQAKKIFAKENADAEIRR